MPRIRIPKRKRVFFGCEGASEFGYGAFLQDIINQNKKDHYLDTVNLGGGDGLALITKALSILAKRQIDEKYSGRVLFLDADQVGIQPNRDQQFLSLASKHKFHIVWQRPSFEAMLLRHLPGFETLRPQSSPIALATLCRNWLGYEKGASAAQIRAKVTPASFVAARSQETELDEFLIAVGL